MDELSICVRCVSLSSCPGRLIRLAGHEACSSCVGRISSLERKLAVLSCLMVDASVDLVRCARSRSITVGSAMCHDRLLAQPDHVLEIVCLSSVWPMTWTVRSPSPEVCIIDHQRSCWRPKVELGRLVHLAIA